MPTTAPLIFGRERRRWCWLVLLVALFAPGCGTQEPNGKQMPRPAKPVSEETARFHEVVEHGNFEELQKALTTGAAVDAPGRVGMTALMLAIASKDLEKMKLLIRHGADPELTDDFNATALRHAVNEDFADAVQLLLSLGGERGYHPKYPLKTTNYALSMPHLEMPAELREVMSEAEWKASEEDGRKSMRESDENPTVEPMISEVQSVAVLKLFLHAGDDLNLAPNDVKRALVGLKSGEAFHSTVRDYQAHKSPLYGSRNPERMDFAFWRDMIRTGGNAYSARKHFEDTASESGAVWCYERFGSSLTPLADGRFVQIGGEHEDYYDPDFFIYNDVVIHDSKGDFEIYGYPQDVFPPTDFHTATLCAGSIYVIGCLGYPDQRRKALTPVYRLKLDSWEMEFVPTTGEIPGWIHGHRAHFEAERNATRIAGGEVQVFGDDGELETVPNHEEFELDLSSRRWRRMK
jgi:hypothetical protein